MTDDAPATVAIPHPYTAEDIDRGYTVTKGDQGREQRRRDVAARGAVGLGGRGEARL
jgi:hypothetical protein